MNNTMAVEIFLNHSHLKRAHIADIFLVFFFIPHLNSPDFCVLCLHMHSNSFRGFSHFIHLTGRRPTQYTYIVLAFCFFSRSRNRYIHNAFIGLHFFSLDISLCLFVFAFHRCTGFISVICGLKYRNRLQIIYTCESSSIDSLIDECENLSEIAYIDLFYCKINFSPPCYKFKPKSIAV